MPMLKMNRIALALLLCCTAVTAAAGQDPQRRIDTARRQAVASGLPVAVLDDKVAEGRAKGVPLERIALAVEHRLGALGRARDVMGRTTPAADLAAGADALDAGVTPEVLAELSRAAPQAQRAVAVAVLAQLVREGVASERALQRVQAALQRGPDALRELPAQAAGGSAGSPPGQSRGATTGNRGQGRGGGPPASVPGPKGRGRGRGN